MSKDDSNNQKSSIELIEFRLTQFETNLSNNFDRISFKLDSLLGQINASEVKQENISTRLEKLEKDFSKVELNKDKLTEEINDMKVSLAEKLSWTAGGGAIAGVLIKLIEGLSK